MPARASAEPAPSRLVRRLGVGDAVVIGLGAMIGSGVFAALAPAAAAAGADLLLGLVIAAFVAYCNATSSAALAALYPESGGTYVYARKRLNAFCGFLAGWGFVIGKLASCAAMALTFAVYAVPDHARPVAVAAVVALTAVNYFGIERTLAVTRIILTVVLTCLGVVVFASALGGEARLERALPTMSASVPGVLQAAGFLFFAFAGYARIATLGEEVIDPARTIPRAIPLALALALLVYAIVAVAALAGVDARTLAASSAPLARVVEAGSFAQLVPVVRAGASVASLGVLLSLLAAVSRTVFAMAATGDLPGFLAAIHPRHRVPHHATLAASGVVVVAVLVADIRDAIGFSAFAVLVYYALANTSALTLAPADRRWSRALALAGVTGCVLLGLSLPINSVFAGGLLLIAGAAVYAMPKARAAARRRASPSSPDDPR